MNQANYIEDSEVMGSVYNNIENIRVSPRGHSNILACKNMIVNSDGKIIGSGCILMMPEEPDKFAKNDNFYCNKPAYSNYDFKGLFGE